MTTPFDHPIGAAPAPGFFAGLRALSDAHGTLFAIDDRARLPLPPGRLVRALRPARI